MNLLNFMKIRSRILLFYDNMTRCAVYRTSKSLSVYILKSLIKLIIDTVQSQNILYLENV